MNSVIMRWLWFWAKDNASIGVIISSSDYEPQSWLENEMKSEIYGEFLHR